MARPEQLTERTVTPSNGPRHRAAPLRLPAIDQRLVVGAVFVVAMFMNILDSTIVNVALPTMARDFHVNADSIEWVVTGYLLGLAVFIPASGWIGDRIGTKRVFLFALAAFTGASILCGLATSLNELIAFRVLQGVGGGMLTPVGTAMLFRAFPPAERAKAASILIIPTVIAPATGPVLGGLLVDTLSWRWVFYVNVPVGVAAFLFGLFFLHEHREPAKGGFDVFGFALSGAGLGLVLYALSQGPVKGWGSSGVLGALVAGLLCFAVLVPVELHRRYPMLRLALLGDRLFGTTNLVGIFAYGSFLGLLFIFPQFLQVGRGTSALVSGLCTFPEAIGVMLLSQLAARLYPRVGPRRLMVGGLVGVSAVMVVLATVGITADLWWLRGLMFLLGASMSFVFMSLQTATFATMSPADTGQASALFNTQRQMAAALGVALLATVFTTVVPDVGSAAHATILSGFRAAFAAAAGIALIGAVISAFIHDKDAANTMRGAIDAAAVAS